MQGAPVLSTGTAQAANTVVQGSLIALLKACLINGFGSTSVSSLVYSSATSSITATVAAGHKFLIDSIIKISGANEANFNGEYRVTSITTTTVTFSLDNGTPASSTATGTITIMIPPIDGWAIDYEDAAAYKIIFKRTDSSASIPKLYIDNSAWTNWNAGAGHLAKAIMVENVTDINTWTTISDRRWVASHNYATSSDWFLLGDKLLFHFIPKYGLCSRRSILTFGDIKSIRPNDKYNCLFSYYNEDSYVTGAGGNQFAWNYGGWYPYYNNNFLMMNDTTHKTLARSHHQMFGQVSCQWKSWTGCMGEGMTFPNPADNGFYVSADPLPIFDDLSFRGYLPSMFTAYSTPTGYDNINIKNMPNIPNKIVKFIFCQRNQQASQVERAACFDLTGPWR